MSTTVSEATCPCCNSEMDAHGDVVAGHMYHCSYCFGILASDRWLNGNIRQTSLRNLRNGVFNGKSAGYRCPTCQGEMVKGPVSTSKDSSMEIDGCLKCGSIWFDNREIEPFFPEIQDLLPESDKSASRWDKALGTLVGIAALLSGSPAVIDEDTDISQASDSEE